MSAYFTKDDVGCYADSARGIYIGQDVVIPLAMEYGFKPYPEPCDCKAHAEARTPEFGDPEELKFANCEYYDDVWNDAEIFLNSFVVGDDVSFGTNENGDWGLWENEED